MLQHSSIKHKLVAAAAKCRQSQRTHPVPGGSQAVRNAKQPEKQQCESLDSHFPTPTLTYPHTKAELRACSAIEFYGPIGFLNKPSFRLESFQIMVFIPSASAPRYPGSGASFGVIYGQRRRQVAGTAVHHEDLASLGNRMSQNLRVSLGLANHAEWSQAQRLFDDCVEIWNPGSSQLIESRRSIVLFGVGKRVEHVPSQSCLRFGIPCQEFRRPAHGSTSGVISCN